MQLVHLSRAEAFRQGLRELGYVEGKNIVIEYRYAEGSLIGLPAFAADLVRLKVDVIVAGGPQATRAAKQATTTIPIVMAGLRMILSTRVLSPALRDRAGTSRACQPFSRRLSGKQLELLKEIVPKLARVAVLGRSSQPGNPHSVKERSTVRRRCVWG